MHVTTADAQHIEYDTVGSGPRIITVDPALASSVMRPLQPSIDVLSQDFEIVTYDRRGRGASLPARGLSVDDEVGDLLAVVDLVGPPVAVLGFSSGGAGVLHAASRLRDTTLVLLEPAVSLEPDTSGLADILRQDIDDGRPDAAVRAFYQATGVPEEIVAHVTASVAWPSLVNSAETLLLDIDLAYAPRSLLESIQMPVHIVVSDGSPEAITEMSYRLAEFIPGAQLWREPGSWHGVTPEALADRLRAVLLAKQPPRVE